MAVKPTFYRRFKGVILLVSSPEAGERHLASDKAFEMCKTEDIGFQDALQGTFGGSDATMQARIDELERDNQLLAEAVQKLRGKGEGTEDGCEETPLDKIWSYPQSRLGAMFVIVFVYLLMDLKWPFRIGFVPIGFALVTLYCMRGYYLGWMEAEDARNGTGVVILKGIIIIGGLVGMACAFLCVSHALGFTVLGTTAFLSLSNAVPMLINRLVTSDGQPFKSLRHWFA